MAQLVARLSTLYGAPGVAVRTLKVSRGLPRYVAGQSSARESGSTQAVLSAPACCPTLLSSSVALFLRCHSVSGAVARIRETHYLFFWSLLRSCHVHKC